MKLGGSTGQVCWKRGAGQLWRLGICPATQRPYFMAAAHLSWPQFSYL